MSLVEAAAALDRLLRGHQEGGAPPNVPPYAPPPTPDDGNLLPTFFPNAHAPEKGSSTPKERNSYPPALTIWDDDPPLISAPDEEPLTPFCRTFSPLPSPVPIPVPTPTLPPLPSPVYPLHWMKPLNQPSEISKRVNALPDVPPKAAKTTDDLSRRRRRKRWSTRANSEGAATFDDEFVPLDPEKYKTELCRSFQVHGHCRYGVRCNYAHGLQELRGASRHGKYKTRNCQSYHQTGFCRYGARCSFIHDPEEGVLKCSIANKEVLEALHHRPSSEDSPRTANITWRLLETSGETIPELHFISSTSPAQDLHSIHNSSDTLEEVFCSHSPSINFFISSDEVFDEGRIFTCTLPFKDEVNVLSSTMLLQENLDLLQSLQAGKDMNKTESQLQSDSEVNMLHSFMETAIVVDQPKRHSSSSSEFTHRLPVFENSGLMSLPLSPIKPATLKEITSEDEMYEETLARPSEGKEVTKDICQELKDLEVVHAILQGGPLYSSTVWSDGIDFKKTGNGKTITNASTQSAEYHSNSNGDSVDSHQNAKRCSHTKGKGEFSQIKRKTKNMSRRKRKAGQGCNLEDIDNYKLNRVNQVLSDREGSVALSNTEDEDDDDGELEVSTGAAGAEGDGWSVKSSLHLADLLRSLRLREGSNQLLPWSKTDRRYSSDGSSVGPVSTKDARSSPSSPASPRQHDMTKYKTELCRSFQYNGYCSYGDACLYAHGQTDLRSYPKHPMYRTKQCFSFHNKGFCLYGSRCQFLHDLE